MIYPLLPALVTGVLGAGPQALGALDGAADFAAAFVKLGAGRLADRPARRGRLVVLGYAVAVLVRPVIAFAAAAWQGIGLRVVDRLGKGLRTPPRDGPIADVTPPPSAARPRRDLAVLPPPHARHARHPPLPTARRVGRGGDAPVGRLARRAVQLELPRRSVDRPLGRRADDVDRVGVLRAARRRDGVRAHDAAGLGPVPRARRRGGADGEPGARARRAGRRCAPGERVRGVSRLDRLRGARGRAGTGGSVPGVWRGGGVRRERRGGRCSGAGGPGGISATPPARRSARVNSRLGPARERASYTLLQHTRPSRGFSRGEERTMKAKTLVALLVAVAIPAAAQDRQVIQPPGTGAGLPFSAAVRVGNMLYLSGQIGVVPGTRQLADTGITGQTRQTLENIKATLAYAGSSLERVVKCTVFLLDIKDFAAMNAVYVTYFPKDPPARSTVAGSGLALGARVEIECLATVA